MRRMGLLLCALCLFTAFAAHGAIEAVRVFVVPPGPSAEELREITYPGFAVFHLHLKGFDGHSYSVRALVLDAKGKTAAEHSWKFTTPLAEASERFDFYLVARNEPGEWRLVVDVDGVRIAERAIPAKRVGPPPAPPLTLVRALVTASVRRNHEPGRPLDVLGLPSAAYYYIETSGFVPNRSYQVHITVTDGAGQLVGDHHFSRTPRTDRAVDWYPVRARAADTPGTWTLRWEFDHELLAKTTIEAHPGASKAKTASVERWWPAVAAAIMLIIGYVGYSLATLPHAGSTAPQVAAAPLLDSSLVALVTANLIPLAMVLYARVNAADVVFLYWCETFILAVYAIPRILIARRSGSEDYTGSGIVAVTIFVLFFGLLNVSWGVGIFYSLEDKSNLFLLRSVAAESPSYRFNLWATLPVEFAFMVAALFVSHGLSFVHTYLKRGAYLATNQKAEMMRVFKRMVFLYVAVVATGIVASRGKESSLVVLAILVALKTAGDVHTHLRARAGLPAPRYDDD